MYQISPNTGFRNIYKLEPGTYMIFKDGRLSKKKYWEINPSEKGISKKKAVEELDDLLNSAVTRQMIADVPIGALLSGGLDSSIIVALMSKNTNNCINTFTIKYLEKDQKFEKMPDDSKYAKKVAHLFHCTHREFEIEPDVVNLLPKIMWHLDEPLADPAAINTYIIAKCARENGIYVLLNGMGGDEVFGGYRKQLACLLADHYQAFIPEFLQDLIQKSVNRLPVATRKGGIRTIRWAKRFLSIARLPQRERYFITNLYSPEEFQVLFSGGRLGGGDYWSTNFIRSQLDIFGTNNLSYLTKMCLCDTQVYLPDHNLTYSDKCMSAVGVEGRPPLTDHRIVEFMFSVPPAYRINGITQKYLLKKVAEKYLPKDIIYRPKAPFGSPLRAWIRGPLKEMIDDYLSPDTLKGRGIYNPAFVWKKIENDRNGMEDNAHLVWTLLCVEIWMRTFFG
jgi:asparagine synthase (glutamine-hydrolysing)